MIVSPIRPMAWESEPIIEIAPEVVQDVLGGDRRRPDPLSAKARSSGIAG